MTPVLVQSLDASGVDVVEPLHKAIVMRGGRLVLAGPNAQPRAVMKQSDFLEKVKML